MNVTISSESRTIKVTLGDNPSISEEIPADEARLVIQSLRALVDIIDPPHTPSGTFCG